MRTLFDQLVAEGEAGIDRLVSEQQQENVTLDFKEKRTPTRGTLDQEDRKTLAKALSAFANSAGGLLIYGVEARKGPDGVDCAQTAKPIAEIRRFLSEAVTATGQLIQPRHEGIEVQAIPSEREAGAGYLLFLVQRSERRPHRSEAAGQKQYFKRAGDSSFEMEHYDIEDAFRRFATPALSIGVRFSPGVRDGAGRILRGTLDLFLDNTSSVTAKMPYLQLCDLHGAGEAPVPLPGIVQQLEGEWFSHLGDASTVVHPGLSRTMASYPLQIEWPDGGAKIAGRLFGWYFSATCRFGCENTPLAQAEMGITDRDLARLMQKNTDRDLARLSQR